METTKHNCTYDDIVCQAMKMGYWKMFTPTQQRALPPFVCFGGDSEAAPSWTEWQEITSFGKNVPKRVAEELQDVGVVTITQIDGKRHPLITVNPIGEWSIMTIKLQDEITSRKGIKRSKRHAESPSMDGSYPLKSPSMDGSYPLKGENLMDGSYPLGGKLGGNEWMEAIHSSNEFVPLPYKEYINNNIIKGGDFEKPKRLYSNTGGELRNKVSDFIDTLHRRSVENLSHEKNLGNPSLATATILHAINLCFEFTNRDLPNIGQMYNQKWLVNHLFPICEFLIVRSGYSGPTDKRMLWILGVPLAAELAYTLDLIDRYQDARKEFSLGWSTEPFKKVQLSDHDYQIASDELETKWLWPIWDMMSQRGITPEVAGRMFEFATEKHKLGGYVQKSPSSLSTVIAGLTPEQLSAMESGDLKKREELSSVYDSLIGILSMRSGSEKREAFQGLPEYARKAFSALGGESTFKSSGIPKDKFVSQIMSFSA